MIDGRDTKLIHRVQKFDIAILELKSAFRGHVDVDVIRNQKHSSARCVPVILPRVLGSDKMPVD